MPAKFSSRFFLLKEKTETLFGLFLLGRILMKAHQNLFPLFFSVTVLDEKAFLQCLDYAYFLKQHLLGKEWFHGL